MSLDFETFEVTYPRRLVRVIQFPPVYFGIAALTGVSISFCPYFLFLFGREGASFTDWRVIVCLAVAYGVPMVYMRLARPVFSQILKRRGGESPLETQ